MTMRACVRTGPGEFSYKTVDVPKPGPGEALLKVTLTSICGSDMHIMDLPPLSGTGEVVNGHEFVGTIEEVGEGVTGFSKGNRVIASCLTPCGTCPNCQRRIELLLSPETRRVHINDSPVRLPRPIAELSPANGQKEHNGSRTPFRTDFRQFLGSVERLQAIQ